MALTFSRRSQNPQLCLAAPVALPQIRVGRTNHPGGKGLHEQIERLAPASAGIAAIQMSCSIDLAFLATFLSILLSTLTVLCTQQRYSSQLCACQLSP